MPRRLAVAVALLVFSVCLMNGMAAGNTFVETVRRGLIGMFVTLVVGLVVGAMLQKMLNENAAGVKKGPEKSERNSDAGDR